RAPPSPAGREMAAEGAARAGGVAEIPQHEPADDRIEALVRLKGIHVRDGKAAPAKAHLRRPCRRAPDRVFGAVDAEHASPRPHQPGGEKSNVAGAAANVEDVHSGADAGAAEDLPGQLAPEGRLHPPPAELTTPI